MERIPKVVLESDGPIADLATCHGTQNVVGQDLPTTPQVGDASDGGEFSSPNPQLVKEVTAILGRKVPLVNVTRRLQEIVFLKWNRSITLNLQLKIFRHRKCLRTHVQQQDGRTKFNRKCEILDQLRLEITYQICDKSHRPI